MQQTRSLKIPLLIVLLVGALVALNAAIKPPGGDQEQEAAQQEAQAKQQAEQKAAPGDQTGGGALVLLPADSVSGSKDAKNQVTLGWSWTPEVQANPDLIHEAIKGLGQMAPSAKMKIRIVNVDAVPGVPLGLSANGKRIMALRPDGGLDPAMAARAMQYAINRPGS